MSSKHQFYQLLLQSAFVSELGHNVSVKNQN